MKISLKDLIGGNNPMQFSFKDDKGKSRVGTVKSIKGDKVVMCYFSRMDEAIYCTRKLSEVSLKAANRFNQIAKAHHLFAKEIKLPKGVSVREAFKVDLKKESIKFNIGTVQLLENFSDKEAKLSFSFGTTENSTLCIIPHVNGDGDFTIGENGTIEGDFSFILSVLDDFGYEAEKMFKYAETIGKDYIQMETQYILQTGENFVSYFGLMVERNFYEGFQRWNMHQRKVESLKSGKKSKLKRKVEAVKQTFKEEMLEEFFEVKNKKETKFRLRNNS